MTRLYVKGIDVDWGRARKHARDLDAQKKNIVTAGGHALLDAANETVPREDDDLADSGHVAVDERGDVVVGYSAPYALRQHEVKMNHQGKGRWKWLEMTARERRAQNEIAEAMADETREALT